MPPLAAPDLSALESTLRQQRETLLDAIRQHLHSTEHPDALALADHLQEVGDWGEADAMNSADLSQISHELRELRSLDSALVSIQHGDYGTCAGCGIDIPLARLQANPSAQNCLPCQETIEKQQANLRIHAP